MVTNEYLVKSDGRPEGAYVILTLNCNSKCKHCYIEAEPGRTESMPMELRRKVIDEISENKMSFLTLTGGEPTVEMDKLMDTLNYAAKKQKETGFPKEVILQTNAYFLKGLDEREIEKELKNLKLAGADSLDITSGDAYHSIGLNELEKIAEAARGIFDGALISGASDDAVVPIGRAKREVPKSKWRTRDYDLKYKQYEFKYGEITVSVDGGIYPCCWQATPPMGNISKEPLALILERARKPGSIFRKLGEKNGFARLEPENDLSGMSKELFDAKLDELSECGACHDYFRSVKNDKGK